MSSAIEIQIWRGILPATQRDTVFALYEAIFEQKLPAVLDQKWATRMDASGLTLLAFADQQPVAYKLGYALDTSVFYSWLGGVLPEFRGQGIGHALLVQQEDWCRQNGYKIIRTKTLNRWRKMLLLNIRNGFDIVDTYSDSTGTLKIVLEKQLLTTY